MSRSQDYTQGDAPASQQHSVSPGGSKVPAERVALLAVCTLLAAAVFVIYRLSLENMQTNRSFQTLRDEHEAVKRNLTALGFQTLSDAWGALEKSLADGLCLKCEEGWEQHEEKCYYFSNNKSPWRASRDACKDQGGDLVKIESRDEQRILEQKTRKKMNNYEDKFWIGLTDSQKEGTWLWVDGSPLNASLTFWSDGEPDNWKGEDSEGEDCVRMGSYDKKGWFDRSCNSPHRRICEKQIWAVK